jgi:hypothetical protein
MPVLSIEGVIGGGQLSCRPVGSVNFTYSVRVGTSIGGFVNEESGASISMIQPVKFSSPQFQQLRPPSELRTHSHVGPSTAYWHFPAVAPFGIHAPQLDPVCGTFLGHFISYMDLPLWVPIGKFAVDGGGKLSVLMGNFVGLIIEIDAPLSSLTKPPIDVPTRTEYVKLTDPTGRHDSCPPPMTPSILNTGMKCDDVTIRCLYLDTYNEGETATKYIDCRCGPDMKLSCADADPSHYVTKGGSGNILASF